MTQSFVRTDTLIADIKTESNSGLLKVGGYHSDNNSDESGSSKSDNKQGPETSRDKFLRSIMDQSKEYPLPVPVINIVQNGEIIPFLTLKSFSLWQGKQKSKKTTVLALAVASFIKGCHNNEDAVHFSNSIGGKVLFFDNEQGESYAARTMRLILKLAGLESSSNLIYCDLREFSPTERLEIIKAGVECTENVRMVVIDGLVDLLNDFMDAREGHLTTTDVLKLCSLYNIHVAGVLHQNKADKNARAHIGTISSQKCEIEIATEVDVNDKSKSTVTCVNSRGLPFTEFAIRWDKGSLPKICNELQLAKKTEEKAHKNLEAGKKTLFKIFKNYEELSRTQAEDAIIKVEVVSESTASRRMTEYLKWGLLRKKDNGNYCLNDLEGSRVHEGSKEGS